MPDCEAALTVQEVAVTLLGVVAAYDLALQPWLRVWFPFPVARHRRHSWAERRTVEQQGADLVPVCALVLRWLLLTFQEILCQNGAIDRCLWMYLVYVAK